MNDEIIYQKPGVLVTGSMVTIKADTYSIRNINSVNISKEDTDGPIKTAFFTVAGLCIVAWFAVKSNDLAPFMIIPALVLAAYLIKSILVIVSPQYYLVFSTSNGKTQALTGKSYDELSPIKQAIETAFSRG